MSLSFGAALAGVQAALKPRIEMNKLNDTIGQIPSLVPGATDGKAQKVGEINVFAPWTPTGTRSAGSSPLAGRGLRM